MRRITLALPGLLLALAPSAVAQPPDTEWIEDYQIALEQSLLTRKPILLNFQTSWCGWCRRLESTTFRSEEFREAVQDFIPVRIDGDRDLGLVTMFRVTGYPTTVLVSRRGREIGRVVGYRQTSPFVRTLESALGRREPFEEIQAAAASRPEDPEAAYALGDALLAVRRLGEARDAFTRVADLDSANASELADDARLDLALTHLFARDFETALAAIENYLAAYPKSDRRDQGIFFQGLALIGAGRVEEGVARVREAAERTDLRYIKREAERLQGLLDRQG